MSELNFNQKVKCPYCHRSSKPIIDSKEIISMIEPIDDGEYLLPKTGMPFDTDAYIAECPECSRMYSFTHTKVEDRDIAHEMGGDEHIVVEELSQEYFNKDREFNANRLNSLLSHTKDVLLSLFKFKFTGEP